jgi:hypothetical protein
MRGFARGPVFALTAILSLAIGVGATTANDNHSCHE